MLKIETHYAEKETWTEKDLLAREALNYLKREHKDLLLDMHTSAEVLEKNISFFDSQFNEKPEKWNKNFQRNVHFISRNKDSYLANEDYVTLLNIVVLWIESRSNELSQQTSK